MIRRLFICLAVLASGALLSACAGSQMEKTSARSTLDCSRSLADVRSARAEVAELRSSQGLMSAFVPRLMTSNGRALRRAEMQLSVLETDYRSGCA